MPALLAGCLTAGLSLAVLWWYGWTALTDFTVMYEGARMVRQGIDPYVNIGPGKLFAWGSSLAYPMPALVILLPLTAVALPVARAILVGVSSFALGYGIARTREPWRFVVLASHSFLTCAAVGQWSIVLLAGFFLPVVGWIAAAKPNGGFAVAVTHPRTFRNALLGGVVFLAISFALQPSWLSSWLHEGVGRSTVYRAPVASMFGPLVLLALLRWRRPEARWLAALALAPHSPGPYTDLLLFAIPRTKFEVIGLAVLSYVPGAIVTAMHLPTFETQIAAYGAVAVPTMMLPCLAMVLRRPNEGELPAWVERWTRRRVILYGAWR